MQNSVVQISFTEITFTRKKKKERKQMNICETGLVNSICY